MITFLRLDALGWYTHSRSEWAAVRKQISNIASDIATYFHNFTQRSRPESFYAPFGQIVLILEIDGLRCFGWRNHPQQLASNVYKRRKLEVANIRLALFALSRGGHVLMGRTRDGYSEKRHKRRNCEIHAISHGKNTCERRRCCDGKSNDTSHGSHGDT